MRRLVKLCQNYVELLVIAREFVLHDNQLNKQLQCLNSQESREKFRGVG